MQKNYEPKTLIYFFESYYFPSWKIVYQNHKGVWLAFQKQETMKTINTLKQDIEIVLLNLGNMNQGNDVSLIRKFSHLQKVENIKAYLENMLDFLTSISCH